MSKSNLMPEEIGAALGKLSERELVAAVGPALARLGDDRLLELLAGLFGTDGWFQSLAYIVEHARAMHWKHWRVASAADGQAPTLREKLDGLLRKGMEELAAQLAREDRRISIDEKAERAAEAQRKARGEYSSHVRNVQGAIRSYNMGLANDRELRALLKAAAAIHLELHEVIADVGTAVRNDSGREQLAVIKERLQALANETSRRGASFAATPADTTGTGVPVH